MGFTEVTLTPRSVDRWRDILPSDRWQTLTETLRLGRAALAGRPIWHINSTATGGGVAEMLRSLCSYMAGVGFDTHWGVIAGDPEFFELTKRLHNHIHGRAGDGGELGWRQRNAYHRTIRNNTPAIEAAIPPGAVVMCHDPQTAGLIDGLRRRGCAVLWRCHIGTNTPNNYSDGAWRFLEPHVADADRLIFSRALHIPELLRCSPTSIITPSVDPFAPKNQRLEDMRAILHASGLLRDNNGGGGNPTYYRLDGSTGTLSARAVLFGEDKGLTPGRPLILQVSRWDRLKDHLGVLQGFVAVADNIDADLLLAGPDCRCVTDDPEGAAVLEELTATHARLPEQLRARVHLAALPMADVDDNAAIVNALQRYASIVVQKSLEEGFGLTITEAMIKQRPVVASDVGGICDQISHNQTGILLADPTNLAVFGETLKALLSDPGRRQRLGQAASAWAHDRFLDDRHIRKMLRQFISVGTR